MHKTCRLLIAADSRLKTQPFVTLSISRRDLQLASIANDPNGRRRIQFVDTDNKRKAIRLGKVSKKDAESVKLKVEALLSCKICGTSPDRDLSVWVTTIAPDLQRKLALRGLIDMGNLPAKSRGIKIQDFLTDYVRKRSVGKKPGTVIIWETAISSLIRMLPKDIAINSINDGHAADWLDSLRSSGLAPTTVYKRIAFARQFFGYALKHKLTSSNPFRSISIPRPKPKSNVEVPRETIDVLFKSCDSTWKAIVTLCRYGGLRCPSEVLSLKWSDVDFDKATMAIPEPKLEHHDNRGVRLCPLFPEVRAVLKDLRRVDDYVVDKPGYREAANSGEGWKNANLRTQFIKQLAKAKLKPWKRLFHSMRASRQTEVEREFGLPAACAWLGNTEAVAKESYLMVFAEEWQRAAGLGGAESGAVAARRGRKTSVPNPKPPTKKHGSQ